MKRQMFGLLAGLLALSLTGCGGTGGAASSSGASSSPSQQPLSLSELKVELPRNLDTAAARKAMEALPGLMRKDGVEIGAVAVTYGTSYAATGQALGDGGVQLAFLPAQDWIRFGGDSVPILADARPALSVDSADPNAWNAAPVAAAEGWSEGTFALICASPTEYGKNLAARTKGGKSLTWAELDQARWGVLDSDSTAGYRCVELWLQDAYEDNGIEDLSRVTTYGSWEDLLRAAADGQIDLLPLLPELREEYAEVWTMDATRTAQSGMHGFGRPGEIVGELPAVAVTPRLQQWVAAVTPGDAAVNDPRFVQALETALEQAFSDPAARLAALGAEHYAPVAASDLDGLRRLTAGMS